MIPFWPAQEAAASDDGTRKGCAYSSVLNSDVKASDRSGLGVLWVECDVCEGFPAPPVRGPLSCREAGASSRWTASVKLHFVGREVLGGGFPSLRDSVCRGGDVQTGGWLSRVRGLFAGAQIHEA